MASIQPFWIAWFNIHNSNHTLGKNLTGQTNGQSLAVKRCIPEQLRLKPSHPWHIASDFNLV